MAILNHNINFNRKHCVFLTISLPPCGQLISSISAVSEIINCVSNSKAQTQHAGKCCAYEVHMNFRGGHLNAISENLHARKICLRFDKQNNTCSLREGTAYRLVGFRSIMFASEALLPPLRVVAAQKLTLLTQHDVVSAWQSRAKTSGRQFILIPQLAIACVCLALPTHFCESLPFHTLAHPNSTTAHDSSMKIRTSPTIRPSATTRPSSTIRLNFYDSSDTIQLNTCANRPMPCTTN